MKLFLLGILTGIAKIIPGVSGSLVLISFDIYDKMINSITHFFDKPKDNLLFISKLGSGIILAIILFSNILKYLLTNYYQYTILFILGLLMGGLFKFSKNIKYNKKNIISILSLILLFMIISNIIPVISIKKNIYMIAGIIEIFSSLIPGISSTLIYMNLGIYDKILNLMSNLYNISFIINNISIYITFVTSMTLSLIILSLFLSYLIEKYHNVFNIIVFSFSLINIASILLKIVNLNLFSIILFIIGLFIAYRYS